MSTQLESPLLPVGSFEPRREGGGRRGMAVLYLALHLLPLTAVWGGVGLSDVALCFALLLARGFLFGAGYHRYLAHRSFKTSRALQFLFAAGGCTALRGGPLWWAGLHRHHHRFSDTAVDVHSPAQGFWWTYGGWLVSGRFTTTPYGLVKDLAAYPELRWLNRNWLLPPALLGGAVLLAGGWGAFAVGFGLSSVLLLHTLALTDALVHHFGTRRYATPDTSRNSFWVSCLSLGEGWHNNHHHYQSSANLGFFWWEVDTTYTALRALSLVGLVWGLRTPPPDALRRGLAPPAGEAGPEGGGAASLE
ncbi:MAG TPA: acyl-CoA desaturase [Gemmataceae bacterium]|nr:acyl-CoA desaturase [Gemmataceae bacterium]